MTASPAGARGERPFRVVVADDDRPYRERLVAGLQALDTIEVAGAAGTGSDVVIEAWRHRPDVVLLDVTLPGMTAAEITRHILRAAPGAAVYLLVGSDNDPGITDALDAGARDRLRKTASPAQIAAALRRAGRE
jgi:DNA-binding NarL/FixJ family response regulator